MPSPARSRDCRARSARTSRKRRLGRAVQTARPGYSSPIPPGPVSAVSHDPVHRIMAWLSITLGRLVPDHDQPIGAGFAAPGFAGPAQHLAHVGAALIAREGLVALAHRIETLDRVGGPVRRPHAVLVIDIDRVGTRLALRHREMRPDLLLRVVAADATGIPEARPQHALGVRPYATRTGALARRLDDGGRAGVEINMRDMVAGQRGVPDLARRRHRDAVGPAPARRSPGVDLAGLRIDASVDAILAGEPDDAALVDHRGVEIGTRKLLRQREHLD